MPLYLIEEGIYYTIEIKRAGIQDLPAVVKMKMEMFREVGSISLLQENEEEKNKRSICSVISGRQMLP